MARSRYVPNGNYPYSGKRRALSSFREFRQVSNTRVLWRQNETMCTCCIFTVVQWPLVSWSKCQVAFVFSHTRKLRVGSSHTEDRMEGRACLLGLTWPGLARPRPRRATATTTLLSICNVNIRQHCCVSQVVAKNSVFVIACHAYMGHGPSSAEHVAVYFYSVAGVFIPAPSAVSAQPSSVSHPTPQPEGPW